MSKSTQAINKPRPLDYLCLLTLALLWGFAFVATKVALLDFGPLSVTAGRMIIAAFLLVSIAIYMRISLIPQKGTWRYFLAIGFVMNAVPFTLLNWGQVGVTSAFAGVSMSIIPLIVLVLSAVFLKIPITFGQLLGLLIGFGGVVLLIAGGNITNMLEEGSFLQKLACLAAAFCYSTGAIIIRIGRDINPIQLSAVGLSIGAVFMVVLALNVEGMPVAFNFNLSFWGLFYLGAGATALATILLVTVINSAGPGFLSLVNYKVPILSVLAGTFILNEQLPKQFFIAFGLILSGLFINELLAKR